METAVAVFSAVWCVCVLLLIQFPNRDSRYNDLGLTDSQNSRKIYILNWYAVEEYHSIEEHVFHSIITSMCNAVLTTAYMVSV